MFRSNKLYKLNNNNNNNNNNNDHDRVIEINDLLLLFEYNL